MLLYLLPREPNVGYNYRKVFLIVFYITDFERTNLRIHMRVL